MIIMITMNVIVITIRNNIMLGHKLSWWSRPTLHLSHNPCRFDMIIFTMMIISTMIINDDENISPNIRPEIYDQIYDHKYMTTGPPEPPQDCEVNVTSTPPSRSLQLKCRWLIIMIMIIMYNCSSAMIMWRFFFWWQWWRCNWLWWWHWNIIFPVLDLTAACSNNSYWPSLE